MKLETHIKRKGVAVLPAVLIFGVVILGIVITGLFTTQLVNRSVFGIRLAEEVEAAARSTVADIHLRLIRDSISLPVLCNDSSPVFTDYAVTVPGRTTIDAGICYYSCDLSVCRYRVRVDAQNTFLVNRRLEAVFDKDVVSGRVVMGELKWVLK